MHNIAIIGSGTMGREHIKYWSQIAGVNVVGVFSVTKESAERLALQHGAETFDSFDQVLGRDDIAIVDVCAPTPFHKDYIVKSLAAGKHVFSEKPLALTLEEGEEIVRAAKQARTKMMVGHVVRFFHEYCAARETVLSGQLGRIGVVRTTRAGGFPKGWQDWYDNHAMSGGVPQDLIIHDLDFLRWCFGDVKRVYAKALTYQNLKHSDYILATLRFNNGTIAHCEGSWAHQPGTFFTRLEICGSKGMLEFDSRKAIPVAMSLKKTEGTTQAGVMLPESPVNENPYLLELKHFIECIDANKQPIVTPADALQALKISLALLESVRSGEVIHIH
jgi:predicted dehydrogenase